MGTTKGQMWEDVRRMMIGDKTLTDLVYDSSTHALCEEEGELLLMLALPESSSVRSLTLIQKGETFHPWRVSKPLHLRQLCEQRGIGFSYFHEH